MYDSGAFRKKFDSFIKNVNEQTENNLKDLKKRRNSFTTSLIPK